MKSSTLYRGSLLAAAALIGGLTIATAQTATDTAPAQADTTAQAAQVTRADFRGSRGDRGDRGGPRRGGMMGQIVEMVDVDGNGAITQVEIDTFRADLVTGADASGEGDISLDEFVTIYLQLVRDRMVDAFQDLDADGDGVVTQAEMDARFGSIVERMDRNDDGQLDRDDQRRGDGRDKGRDGGRSGPRRG